MSWDVFGLAINQVVGDALKAFAGPGAVPLSTGPGGVPFPLEPAPAPPGPVPGPPPAPEVRLRRPQRHPVRPGPRLHRRGRRRRPRLLQVFLRVVTVGPRLRLRRRMLARSG